jgi:hypothetical protein
MTTAGRPDLIPDADASPAACVGAIAKILTNTLANIHETRCGRDSVSSRVRIRETCIGSEVSRIAFEVDDNLMHRRSSTN